MPMQHYDWSRAQARRLPNKIAIIDHATGRQLSYAELDKRASALAASLQNAGIRKSDRVALLALNGPEHFELEFACAKIGAISVPLNWRLTENELTYIVGDCSPKVLVHSGEFAGVATALQGRCDIQQLFKIDPASATTTYEAAITEGLGLTYEPVIQTHDDVTMIMYTSGTTGHPKGAMITHGMNFINCVNTGIPARITPDTVQLVVLPLFHTGGLNCYANPVLHAGGKVVICREFEPGQSLDLINDPALGITHLFAVPAPYQFMMNHPKFAATDLSRIVTAGVGGAPCAEIILETWQARGVRMSQGWGMTETSPGGSGLDPDDAVRKLGSCGKTVLHSEIKIVDDEGEEVPAGVAGELLIKGPNVTPGYWNKPEATASSFVDGWLKTGDAAKFDDEGFLYIVDRWKDMYISGGENVYPAEVENVIYQLEAVAEAAVIGIPHERWGETGKAVIVVKDEYKLDEHRVIAHCLENLAKFKIPETVEFVDALPRNATGKVLKRTLREQFLGSDAPAIS